MTRATEHRAEELAQNQRDGWVLIEHPVALPGWYPIRRIWFEFGWVYLDCARPAAVSVAPHSRLWWAPVRPPEQWWIPW